MNTLTAVCVCEAPGATGERPGYVPRPYGAHAAPTVSGGGARMATILGYLPRVSIPAPTFKRLHAAPTRQIDRSGPHGLNTGLVQR